MILDDALRKAARAKYVKFSPLDLFDTCTACLIRFNDPATIAWVQDELACDGVKLAVIDGGWYLGPLGE